MNREDAKKILTMFQINYPNSYSKLTKEKATVFVNLWTDAFKNLPCEIVFKAVKEIIYQSESDFAPNIGQVNSKIRDIVAPEVDMEAIKAWEELRKFIRRMSRDKQNDMQDYMSLNQITRSMYDYNFILSMSYMESAQIEYRRNEFLRMFKERSEKKNLAAIQTGNFIALSDNGKKFKSLGFNTFPTNQQKELENLPKRDVSKLVSKVQENSYE